ncbi:expressed unknown protein [Seminavis robusta]|uniref:Uncharacterized protein n=1 Tax=Seminavis robusta TaxID=568900 RepID=A0A9N8HAY8_9STRA|nr:expressed unknown protein [Seminavis robusta]|eukprot:Sro339_g121140.1 n/a (147) ;mRNA; r:70222-70662
MKQLPLGVLRRLFWTLFLLLGTIEMTVDGFQEPPLENVERNAKFYEECSLKDVENICARNITMSSPDGSIIRAPGVTVWIQAHCGSEQDEHKRSVCVLSYIGDDFGEDQAAIFFSCVCDECPRACHRQGNLRNRQNQIAMDSHSSV